MFELRVRGHALTLGNNIDTDTIIPARYLHKLDLDWLAQHVFDDDPSIKERMLRVQKPIVIVAGSGFGYGSSREHAVLALKASGVAAIIAKSFHRIFFRNAVNNGLPVIEASLENVSDGALVEIDLERGTIAVNGTVKARVKPMPSRILQILLHGGLKAELKMVVEELSKAKKKEL